MKAIPTAERSVFVDTGIFHAFVDRSDQDHQTAVELFQEAETRGQPIITSNFVVAETHALLLSKLGRQLAARWLEAIVDYARIQRISRADETRAREIIFQFDDKDFSYTDATCFAVMERLGIQTVFSLDAHFLQYGRFIVLPGSLKKHR